MNNKKQKVEEGQLVRFKAFSVLSGSYEEMGKVECEGTAGIARGIMGKEEYGGLRRGEAYVVKRQDNFGNNQRHLVLKSDILEILSEEA